ncbi:MAG: mevalonate kinase [Legionellales bacterium RIFCSPHIGHO2_12_FULL_37_14]|nr:MAG: mevalonate kinase [Legionellales bacterium RIFCSPHIGHO2_12_FULL_37_14]
MQNSFDFKTTTYAKWILTGEHAVLRGHGAIVFPIATNKLTLHYSAASKGLNADFTGQQGEALHLLFWSVLEHGLKLLAKSLNQIKGSFLLFNNIPIGVGMGASAALCVAVTRWFIYQGWLNNSAEFSFAKSLEDLCHGKSSGLDIVGVRAEGGVYFQNGVAKPIEQTWEPHLYLSFCGQQGFTLPCISKVEDLWLKDAVTAQKCDDKMHLSVMIAMKALAQKSEHSLDMLANSINLAQECFNDWGLINATMANHIASLQELGAIAVKPTGSGSGGYLISLWKHALTLEFRAKNQCEWIEINHKESEYA